jgi:hypothetical protein
VDRFFQLWQGLLCMTIAPFRNLPAFVGFHRDDLLAFYEWINSKAVAGYDPMPTPSLILTFERQCWSEIELLMADGTTTLKEAMKKVMDDHGFLIRELYHPADKQSGSKGGGAPGGGASRWGPGGGRGPGKGRGRTRTPKGRGQKQGGRQQTNTWEYSKGAQDTWQPGKGQGKGGKAGKGGGKAGGKTHQNWPSQWAVKDPKGTKFCTNHHLFGSCAHGAQCSFSHNCPVKSSTGFVCNAADGKHTKDACPQLNR